MNMLRKYVSDVIAKDKVEKLIVGNNYLIGSEMGSGKNYWVRNTLLPYAYDDNKKVLILASRKAIKDQQYNYLDAYKKYCIRNFKGSTFIIISYQKFERLLCSKKQDDYNFLNQFNFIVCDEAHYFTKDTSMNNKTVLSFNWLNNNDYIIKIFMTATYESLEYLPFKKDLEVLKDAEYSNNNVNEFYRYESQETIVPIIQSEIDEDKKVIIVNNRKDDLNEWSDTIVGQVQPLTSSNRSSSIEFKNIVERQKFECDVLNTTSLICEGTEIFDDKVETIIINGLSDLESFVQTTARIRTNKVNVYYKKITSQTIAAKLRNIEKQLFYYDEFVRLGEIEFVKQYGLDIIEKSMKTIYLDVVISPLTGDEIITLRTHITNLSRLRYEYDLYGDIRIYGFERRVLDKYFPNVVWYDMELIKRENMIKQDIIDIYKDRKIFVNEKNTLKNILVNKYGVRTSSGSKNISIVSINKFLIENNINYTIISDKESKGEFRNQNYWAFQEVV